MGLVRSIAAFAFLGVVAATVGVIWLHHTTTVQHLLADEFKSNAALTRVVANNVWDKFGPALFDAEALGAEEFAASPEMKAVHEHVQRLTQDTSVIKVKIFNRDGITVFSTDPMQVGESRSDNDGFRKSLAEGVASNLTYRDQIDTFEGHRNSRTLIATYVPVRAQDGGEPLGVIELYRDVTDLFAQRSRVRWLIALFSVAVLAALYCFLASTVRRTEAALAVHERERARAEAKAWHLAYHDGLTGLPNRANFTMRLRETLDLARRHQHSLALMYVDLDRFKHVNDSMGHAAGDALLQKVASRVQSCLRGSDLLFRVGGDEFVVILSEITSTNDGADVAKRIMKVVASPMVLSGHDVSIGATVGIAVYPGDADTAEKLIKNADAAMYSAKQSGGGCYAFYSTEMNARAMQRLALEATLQTAFDKHEFELHYQPRLDAATQRVVGAEALLRWQCPWRGLVQPDEFINVMEDMGLMPDVAEWVLRSACEQVKHWCDDYGLALKVSVNVSARHFQTPGFVGLVRQVLMDTGVQPNLIELELTESMLVTHPDVARATIASLKALGVSIAIDDFGTGYSSLNYLQNFAVDSLKIDRSFVTDVATSRRSRAVVRAIVDLAHALDINVVAEGVETQAQADFFISIQCGELQGFLYSQAVTADVLRSSMVGQQNVVALPRPTRPKLAIEKRAAWAHSTF